MNRNVLLSIKPEYAYDILNGDKLFEYRRAPPAISPPYKNYLYASNPVQKVVGEAVTREEVRDNVENIIKITCDRTTSTPEEIREYFHGVREACALKMEDTYKYALPKELKITPPQNFMYVEEKPWKISP